MITPPLPEQIEVHRDRMWRRDEDLRVESAVDVERFIEDVGFVQSRRQKADVRWVPTGDEFNKKVSGLTPCWGTPAKLCCRPVDHRFEETRRSTEC